MLDQFVQVNAGDATAMAKLMDHTSVLRFIEKNWDPKRVGDQSFDAVASDLDSLFNFDSPRFKILLLDPKTGLKKGR